MGIIVKAALALCVGWGVLHMIQQHWLETVKAQITEPSGLQLPAQSPVLAGVEIDPEKMRRAANPPVTIDTRAYQRAAIEGMTRDMIRQNNDALSRAAVPPRIPGYRP